MGTIQGHLPIVGHLEYRNSRYHWISLVDIMAPITETPNMCYIQIVPKLQKFMNLSG